MRAIRLVFFKEVLDNLRDRRTVLGTLLMGALIGPITFALIFNLVLAKEMEKAEQALELVVSGPEHAPMLIRYLRQRGVTVEATTANLAGLDDAFRLRAPGHALHRTGHTVSQRGVRGNRLSVVSQCRCRPTRAAGCSDLADAADAQSRRFSLGIQYQ